MVDARTPLDPWRAPPLRLVDDTAAEERTIEVVLACSSADAPSVTAAAELLGMGEVRILPGIDVRTDHLRAAVVRASLPTLFVVCRSPNLDAEQARLAAGTFGSRRIAHHRLLVAQYDTSRPGPWITAIRRAWSSMQAAFEVSSGPVAGMVGSGHGNAVGGETRSGAPTTENLARRGPLVRIAAVSTGRIGGEASQSPASWRDAVGTIPAHVRMPGRSSGVLAVVDPQQTRDTEDDGPAAASDAVLVRAPEREPSPAASSVVEPAPNRAMRIGASALVGLVVVAFAAVPTLGDRDAASVGSSIGAVVAVDEHTDATGPSSAIAEDGPAPSVVDLAAPAVEPPRAASPSSAPLVAPPPKGPPPSLSVPDVEIPSPSSAPKEARMAGLYVVDGPNVPLDWYAAANTCRGRKVDGQRGFRLPTIDELRWLRRGGRVAPGRAMWTGSRVHGATDANWILDAKGTMSRLGKTEGVAFTVCVRMP